MIESGLSPDSVFFALDKQSQYLSRPPNKNLFCPVANPITGRGFTTVRPDPGDGRRIVVALTPTGSDLCDRAAPIAALITNETLRPLDAEERSTLVALLRRLA